MRTPTLSPIAELRGLQQQISGLQGGILPRLGALQQQAAPRLKRLMRHAELAAEYAPEVSALLDRVLHRGEPALESTGFPARIARHRVLLTGVLIGAGLLAYDLWADRVRD